jgi:hypothetical protein
MSRQDRFAAEFVEEIPNDLQPARIYISIRYSVMTHLCACGCGAETVTPLQPENWSFTYDGATVTLYPSIDNYSYPCQSHYWIKNGKVRWARTSTPGEIAASRALRGSRPAGHGDTDSPPKNQPRQSWLWRILRRNG